MVVQTPHVCTFFSSYFCVFEPQSPRWGDEADESDTVMPELRVDEPATRELLSVVYPHLIVDGEDYALRCLR